MKTITKSQLPRYRDTLPQLGDALFLADGGLETTMVFLEGLELPDFASFDLLRRAGGPEVLRKYYRTYIDLARRYRCGLVLESVGWRASRDWGARLGYDRAALREANRHSMALMASVRDEAAEHAYPIVLSGCLGPRGDGYNPDRLMSEAEAADYHTEQALVLRESGADMLSAMTMNYAEEAVGIALAARRAGMPVAVSFTVETDGRLATGQSLRSAILQVEQATDAYPAYYMINCAHPSHFADVLDAGASWVRRIRGIRANASCKSHAELNESTELDPGDPVDLGARYAALLRRLPHLTIMGGCCGTDHRHMDEIARAVVPLKAVAA